MGFVVRRAADAAGYGVRADVSVGPESSRRYRERVRPRRHVSWWPFHWSARKWKRTELPDELRASRALQPGERILSFGYAGDGSGVVATDRGLWLREDREMHRVDWARIGILAPTRRRLAFTYLSEELQDQEVREVDLADPGEVVDAAWDQMADYTICAEKVLVQGSLAVRVVGRRSPYSDEVYWGFVPDPGLDLADSDVQMRAAEALFRVRAEHG